jgi:hypothetical protein
MKMHLPVPADNGDALSDGCAGVLADCLLMHLPVVAEDGTC